MVFSIGVLPRLGLEPRTIGQQPNALTVRPFNALNPWDPALYSLSHHMSVVDVLNNCKTVHAVQSRISSSDAQKFFISKNAKEVFKTLHYQAFLALYQLTKSRLNFSHACTIIVLQSETIYFFSAVVECWLNFLSNSTLDINENKHFLGDGRVWLYFFFVPCTLLVL